MKTKFEIDTGALTIRDADRMLASIAGAIETMIKSGGFQFKLRASDVEPVISYIIEDTPEKTIGGII